jgi:hypothetical protein
MKNLFLILCMLTISFAKAQEDEAFSKTYLICARASIGTGSMFHYPVTNVYLSGNVEYFSDELVSFRANVDYLEGSLAGNHFFKNNISSFAGVGMHFTTEEKFDPYIAIQPGAAFITSYYSLPDGGKYTGNPSITPLLSASAGFNYFASRYFHLFLNGQFVYGQHIPQSSERNRLEEIRITFGLGFNIQTRKLY